MALSRADVEYVAHLSRLELDEQTIERMSHQLGRILEYIAKLNELNTEHVEPMSHPFALRNVMREDEPRPSLPREDVLRNAPEQQDGFFKAPKVIE